MLEKCRQETKEAMDNILSIFGAEDGGGKFYRLYCKIEELDVMAQEGDQAADELIFLCRKFSRFIDVVSS